MVSPRQQWVLVEVELSEFSIRSGSCWFFQNPDIMTLGRAGQWGTALSYACALFGMECEVWQVGASYDAKPARKLMMQTFGAKVHRSPSDATEAGRTLRKDPKNHSGSLGIAISEAVEAAVHDETTAYALGSVLNHVLLHQTVIGEEALRQLAKVEETPDLIVGCVGGGSNFAGLAFPFLREKLQVVLSRWPLGARMQRLGETVPIGLQGGGPCARFSPLFL